MNELEIENYLRQNGLITADVVRAVQTRFPDRSKRYIDRIVRDMFKGTDYAPVYGLFIEKEFPGIRLQRPAHLERARQRKAALMAA
jgi:hypothetical protein